ncbi:hypothetical protein D9M68_953650 [compost metagenome]
MLPLADIRADPTGHGREAIVGYIVAQGSGRLPASEGDSQVVVAFQGLRDEPIQYRILELLPPEHFKAAAIEVRVLQRRVHLHMRRWWLVILRPDCASSQQQSG